MRTPDIPVHQMTTASERLELSANWMHLDHAAMAAGSEVPSPARQRTLNNFLGAVAEPGVCHYHTVDTGCVVWHT